jgi:4,5-dihydroxyphthalate decarboxylase
VPVRLSLAVSPYDHTRELLTGAVAVPGIELQAVELPVEEIIERVTRDRAFDVAEYSFGRFVEQLAAGDTSLRGLPVFPSRAFRQSAMFVRTDSPLRAATDLRGRRVGIPAWNQTTVIYVRGWLHDQIGIGPHDVEWVLPGDDGTARPRTLDQLLLDGRVDAVVAAHPPAAAGNGGAVRPLLDSSRTVEQQYAVATGIVPIMHLVVARRAVLDEHPWVAERLTAAFGECLDRSVARMVDRVGSRVPLLWTADHHRQTHEILGFDPFRYGIDANRMTLAAFVRFAYEQGVTRRLVTVDELFA